MPVVLRLVDDAFDHGLVERLDLGLALLLTGDIGLGNLFVGIANGNAPFIGGDTCRLAGRDLLIRLDFRLSGCDFVLQFLAAAIRQLDFFRIVAGIAVQILQLQLIERQHVLFGPGAGHGPFHLRPGIRRCSSNGIPALGQTAQVGDAGGAEIAE